MTAVNPYLTFTNNCEEAFEFYRSVFGGEFAAVLRMTDIDCGVPVSAQNEKLIMHIALPISEGSVLMGSDAPEGFGPPLQMGNNFSVAVAPDTREEADRLHAGLSAGGAATMPMADAPWGDYFGMVTDKFGVQWLINQRSAA
jgi:PhnB protein